MRVNQDFTGFFNILVNNPDSLTRVQVGQVLAARVLEILAGGQALIMLNGEKILAETQVPMQKGQGVLLEVTGLQQGQLHLKVLPDSGGEGLPVAPEQVVKTLTQANLPVDDFHLGVVRELLQHNLPATPANIKQVLAVLQNLGSKEPTLITETVRLMARELPVTVAGALISAIVGVLEGGPEPSQQQSFGQVRAALEQVVLSKPQPVPEPEVSQQVALKNPLPKLIQHLEQILQGEKMPDANINRGASPTPRNLPVTPDALVKVLQDAIEYAGQETIKYSGGSEKPVPQINPGTNSEVKKEQGDFINPVADREQIVGQLIRLLERKPHPVKALLQEAGMDQGTSLRPVSAAPVSQVEAALALLENPGERAEQSGQRTQGEVYYLPLPLRNEQQTRMGELYVWRREPHEAKSLEEGLYLAFFLTTENLGSLRIDIAVKGYHLEVHFLVESSKVAEVIQQGLQGLAAALRSSGFEPDSLQCKVNTRVNKPVSTPWAPSKSGLDLLV